MLWRERNEQGRCSGWLLTSSPDLGLARAGEREGSVSFALTGSGGRWRGDRGDAGRDDQL